MLLLCSTMDRSFIREDLGILRSIGRTRYVVGSGPPAVPRFWYHASRSSLALSWFASVYSLPVVLGAASVGAPSVIVVGGGDAAAMPEIGYGLWLDRRKGRLVRSALRRASAVIAVDRRLLDSLRELSGLALDHGTVVPTGYDPDFWRPAGEGEEGAPRKGPGPTDVLCVASCDSHRRGLVKGIDLYLAAASRLPDLHFRLIGADRTSLLRAGFDPPANLEAIGELSREEVRGHYHAARLYCQASRHEGLPNALCEALLCGTPAVATDVGGSRSVLGGHGVLIGSEDLDGLIDGIRQGLDLPSSTGRSARTHVATTYPLDRRRHALTRIVHDLRTR